MKNARKAAPMARVLSSRLFSVVAFGGGRQGKGGGSVMLEAPAEMSAVREKAPESARKVVRRAGIWLDRWALRPYGQDTHSWAAKMETIRGLQTCRSWREA